MNDDILFFFLSDFENTYYNNVFLYIIKLNMDQITGYSEL